MPQRRKKMLEVHVHVHVCAGDFEQDIKTCTLRNTTDKYVHVH